MKKCKYLLYLGLLVVGFCFYIDNVGAVTFYSCTNADTDTCSKREYKYSKDGSAKGFSITLGVFHYKNADPNNENLEFVKSFDGCDAIQSTTNCSVDGFRFYADKLTVAVNSSKDYFPVAICAIPYLNSQPLNQPLSDYNVRNYMYFSASEVSDAISNGYCIENNVYYTELNHTTTDNVAKICVNKTNIYDFNSNRDLTGTIIQTNFHNNGLNKICSINAGSGTDKMFVYNHYDSDKLCTASSYDISCTGSGTYNCTLSLCGNASNATVENMVGKKCFLYNDNDSDDKIEYRYTFNKAEGLVHSHILMRNDKMIKKSIVPGRESYALSSSCPDYIYYDKTVDKYYILSYAEKAIYDKEHTNNDIISYRFINSSDMDILEEDELNNFETNFGDKVDVSCEGIIGSDLLDYIDKLFGWVKISVPIILIVFGCIDFGQAIISDDKDIMKKSASKFIKRCVVAIIIFFLPTLLSFLLHIFNALTTDAGITVCGIG